MKIIPPILALLISCIVQMAIAEDTAIISDRENVELIQDSNLAEAVSRRPDLDFRNVTIDGEVATVSLNDIQADQVESAEVSKSVTPDRDADLRGGGLNLRSKPTYNLEKRVIKVALESYYDPILESFDKLGTLTYGNSSGRWGFMVTGSAENGPFASESYRQDWIGPEDTGFPEFVLKEQRIYHSLTGETEFKANATIDFKLNNSVRIYFKGDWRQSDREGYRPRVMIKYNKGDYSEVSGEGALVEGAWIERYLSAWNTDSGEHTLVTGGYLDFASFVLDYQISINESGYDIPDMVAAKFSRRRLDLRYSLKREFGPEYELVEDDQSGLNDPSSYRNDWISLTHLQEENRVLLGAANLRMPVYKSWFHGYIKTGIKLRGLEYDTDSDEQHFDNDNRMFTLADVLSDYSNPQAIGGLYDHGPAADYSGTRDYFFSHQDTFTYNLTRSREESDPQTYATGQDVYAGYGMAYLDLDSLRLIVGLRYERTDLDYVANELILDEQGEFQESILRTDTSSYSNLFPGIHARYDLGRFSLVGSWSNTINRPDFERVVPFRNIRRETESIDAGNPGLMPTTYSNYDLAVDYRLNGSDLLSMELFYQTVEDIVYYETTRLNSGPFEGFEFGTSKNGPTGEIYGLRLLWSQKLDHWIRVVRGFSMNARYTHRVSSTEYPARPGVILPMPRRPKNSFDLNLVYKSKRFFAQLEFGYTQSSLDEISEEKQWRDIYGAPHTRLDLSTSYQVADGVRFLFEIVNLTEQRRGEDYYGDKVLLSRYNHTPRRYRLGLKFDL